MRRTALRAFMVFATLLSTFRPAGAALPSCAETTPARIAVTSHQRFVAGEAARPKLRDKTFGFAWPDTALNPILGPKGLVFFASDGGCHAACRNPIRGIYGHATRTEGTLDNPLGSAPPIDATIQPNPDPQINPAFASYTYVGGGPVYQPPAGQVGAGHLLMLYHAEINTKTSFYSLLALAASSDFGRHWVDLGEIIRPNTPYSKDFPGLDVGDPRFLVSRDGEFFLLYFSDLLVTPKNAYTVTSAARAPVHAVLNAAFVAPTPHAATFTKYYAGDWSQPGLGGLSTDLMLNSPYGGTHAAYDDTAISRYVMVLDDGDNISYALSHDGIAWTVPALFGAFATKRSSADYASPIGGAPDPDVLGADFDVAFTFSYGWPHAVVKSFGVRCQ